jgi:heme/copper-type cytochrome/quinol oxidase subunit 3
MEIPYTVSARRDTGLFNAKVGIWLFLASEVMLFGGLFSGYVFLRAGVRPGVDLPWPDAVYVHGPFIWLGFLNTLVLIASSVFVVLAWAQLKMRRYGMYQFYMSLVLICAAVFMVVKTVEYNSKLNHHFGARLKDGTLLDGALVADDKHHCPGDYVTFEATKAVFSLDRTGVFRKLDPYFLDFAVLKDGAELVVKAPGGQEVRGIPGLAYWLEDYASKNPSERRVTAEFLKPVTFQFRRKEVFGKHVFADRVPLFRGNELQGKLIDDTVEIEVHTVDLQMVRDEEKALAWSYLGEGYKAGYDQHKKEKLNDPLHRSFLEKGGTLPGAQLRIWQHPHPASEHGGEHAAGSEHGGKGASGHGAGEGHGAPVVSIKSSDIHFMGAHGPKFGTYYAIYFTMTALHGLHVVGGALVLAYFLFFGRKLYRKNPEHLANRVEVGGLFWHFVDLVWIFLFPIMYLM